MRRPLCFICLAFAVLLYPCIWLCDPSPPGYPGLEWQTAELEGQVSQKEYRVIGGEHTLVLYLKSILFLESNGESPANPIQGVMCYMKKDEGREPPIGSRVRVLGSVMNFSAATNPGEFDMRAYYHIQRLSFRLGDAVVTGQSSSYDRFGEQLYRIRRHFAAVLDNCFTEEAAGIMKAMLLGEKGSLDGEIKQLYQESGIIHILAISGLHISIIGMGVYRFLRKCSVPPIAAAIPSFFLIFCYALMTGISPSALRAVIMFSLHLLAEIIGRTYDLLTAVSVAAVLLLAEQPLYLTHTGFLFSFGAVIGIALFCPVIKKEVPASSGIGVLLFTLPIHLYYYYQFPIYSVILNLLVIPLMSFVMGSGILAMTIGGVLPYVGRMAAWIGEGILYVYEKACVISTYLPGSIVITGKPHAVQVLFYMGVLILLIGHYKKLPVLVKWLFIITAISVLTYRFHEGLTITMVDVGQGDGIHIQSDSGRHYLIDGGSSSKKELSVYQLVPYLKSQGAAVLEAVIITHADMDHISGVIGMLEEDTGIVIKNLVLPDIGEASRNESFRTLEALALARGIPVVYLGRGDAIRDGRLTLTGLHPQSGYRTEEANEYSLVLYLEYGSFLALFTGDIEGEGEREMQEYLSKSKWAGRQLTLLKTAHHGSGNSTSKTFLEEYSPMAAFISCGEKNSYGHPHPELLARLREQKVKVYITKERGALRLQTDGKRTSVTTFLHAPLQLQK